MLVPNQRIKIKWHPRNRKWYEDKDYKFTNWGDEFTVAAGDLSKGAKAYVKVQCDYCMEIHDTLWRDYYIRKSYGKYACTNCRLKKASETTLESRRNNLYCRAKAFCDEYGYTILTPIEEIANANTRINYLCPKHGLHNTKIYTLITRHRCIDCIHEDGADNLRLSVDEIIDYVEDHDSKWINPYDYSKTTDKNMKIICPECREEFTTSFFAFRKRNGQRCPDCTSIESRGEYKVRQFLEAHGFNYVSQYRFYDCRTSVPLPFDFYLINNNIAIEYDGAGHYIPIRRGNRTIEYAKEALKNVRHRDKIKTDYCENNGIKLIRIPYWNFDDIENILYKQLFDLHEDIV